MFLSLLISAGSIPQRTGRISVGVDFMQPLTSLRHSLRLRRFYSSDGFGSKQGNNILQQSSIGLRQMISELKKLHPNGYRRVFWVSYIAWLLWRKRLSGVVCMTGCDQGWHQDTSEFFRKITFHRRFGRYYRKILHDNKLLFNTFFK